MNFPIEWVRPAFPELTDLAALATGGQKVVFTGRHPTDGSIVLKVIQPTQNEESIRRELLAVQQVQSNRVPRIYEHGVIEVPIGHCVWFREQRITGKSLRDHLSKGPLETPDLLRLGLHTLEALAAAEAVDIVHRDVKPENLMRDTAGNFWLLDFGIARHLQLESQTPTVQALGKCTPGYAPPEQFRNIKDDIDARTDLFALGVTLYECATGTNPLLHGARDMLECFRRVETQVLPRLQLSFPQAGAFADLVVAMTQRKAHHRPETAKDALVWMQQIVAGEA